MLIESSKILAESVKNGEICSSPGGIYFLKGYEKIPEEELKNARMLKDSRTISCGVFRDVFIKRYNRKSLWKYLKRLLGYPRSFRCLAVSLLLKNLSIQTPKVLHASRYFLMTEALPEEKTVFLQNAPEMVREFLPSLVQLHNAGISHGDLSLRNIYFDREKETFGLIDFDGSSIRKKALSSHLRTLELARIISSCFLVLKYHGKAPDLEAIMEEFLAVYEEKSGMTFSRKTVLKRTRHLLR